MYISAELVLKHDMSGISSYNLFLNSEDESNFSFMSYGSSLTSFQLLSNEDLDFLFTISGLQAKKCI